MAKRAGGLSQQLAADAVGISVRSTQRIDRGNCIPELAAARPSLAYQRRSVRRGLAERVVADAGAGTSAGSLYLAAASRATPAG